MQSSSRPAIPLFGVFKIFSFFTLAFTLLSLFSAFHHLLELTAHFKLQYFIASLFFCALYIYLRSYLLAAAFGICICINGYFVIPWHFSEQSIEHSAINNTAINSFKLMHANVLSSNQQFQQVIDLVEKEKPDIVILQEISPEWQQQLNGLTEAYPHNYVIARLDNFGIALLSKFPLDSIEEKYWGQNELPALKTSFQFDENTIQLVTTHFLPPGGRNNLSFRNRQASAMMQELTSNQQPLLLVGDFNITMWSNDYPQLLANDLLFNAREGFGVLATWPAALTVFGIPIDHIFLSRDFIVKDIYTGSNIGSDHLPLIAIISLVN